MTRRATVRSDVTLRPTSLADLAEVTAWERHPENAAWVEVWPYERHLATLSDRSARHLMVERDGRRVGYVILLGLGGRRPVVELRRIVVTDKGRGTGRAAVDRVVRHAFEELDASEVWLDVVAHNRRAAHVYTACGFQVDPDAELEAEIAGVPTRLVKMSLSRPENP